MSMTLSEFRAWLSGFEEAMGSSPTEEQWQKIKAKLDAVTETPSVVINSPEPVMPHVIVPSVWPTSPSIPTYPWNAPIITCTAKAVDGTASWN